MGTVDRERAMELFQYVHRTQLARAYNMLHLMGDYCRWRIALHEELPPLMLDEEQLPSETITCIDVRLDCNGNLEAADEPSRKAIESWEQRYYDKPPYAFELPLFFGGRRDGAFRD